jgi:hypothetical protein
MVPRLEVLYIIDHTIKLKLGMSIPKDSITLKGHGCVFVEVSNPYTSAPRYDDDDDDEPQIWDIPEEGGGNYKTSFDHVWVPRTLL